MQHAIRSDSPLEPDHSDRPLELHDDTVCDQTSVVQRRADIVQRRAEPPLRRESPRWTGTESGERPHQAAAEPAPRPWTRALLHGEGLPYEVAPHLIAEQVLGSGGTAVVLQATHTRLRVPVAIKLLNVEEAPGDAADWLRREAELYARLRSRFVPRVYDLGELDDGTPYMVMEHVEGITLDQLLADGPLDVYTACTIASGILEALIDLHSAGVVHRDLKPSNVMIRSDDVGPTVMLLDLGVAKALEHEMLRGLPRISRDSRLIGTPHYMSFEQICTGVIDERTDLYAFGVMFYEMLSGEVPFDGDTVGEVIASVLRDPPRKLSERRADIPLPLDELVRWTMRRVPEARPQSAEAVLGWLRRVMESTALLDAPSGGPPAAHASDLPTTEVAPRQPREPWLPLLLGLGVVAWVLVFWSILAL